MGAEGSTLQSGEEPLSSEFVSELEKACKANGNKGDLKAFRDRWEYIRRTRLRADPNTGREEPNVAYDNQLVDDDVMRWVKFATRHQESAWREEGIKIARSFFYLSSDTRMKLDKMDFVGSLLLVTLSDDKDEDSGEEDDDTERHGEKAQDEKSQQRQILAAEVVYDMAQYDEFADSLRDTRVLNFLCIVLNQVPAARTIVTHTFVKLSDRETNLVVLMEGAVGDVLESFFKTVGKWCDDEKRNQEWTSHIPALGHCAHTLATLIKYGHQCQVDLATIVQVFNHAVGSRQEGPENVRLLAEMARLFYWVCRSADDLIEKLSEAAPSDNDDKDSDFVLHALMKLWTKCVETHHTIEDGIQCHQKRQPASAIFERFCVDDQDRSIKLRVGSPELQEKIYYARMRLCYVNCLLWVLLPVPDLRWKLKDFGFRMLYLACELREEAFLVPILGTMRHLVDSPRAQECPEIIRFFGEELLDLLRQTLENNPYERVEFGIKQTLDPMRLVTLLLDAISVLTMQRGMQEMMAEPKYDIHAKLNELMLKVKARYRQQDDAARPVGGGGGDENEIQKVRLAKMRILSSVAMHPNHRMNWVTNDSNPEKTYPPRAKFEQELSIMVQGKNTGDDNLKTISSLLLTVFQESKFNKSQSEVEATLRSLIEWWKANSTARYEDLRDSGFLPDQEMEQMPLKDLLVQVARRQEERCTLTCMEAMRYCAPNECVLVLSLFSRLALEPKFKKLFVNSALEALLRTVLVGVWVEAREAAATLANLMWLPDMDNERLVCWLKFDGPKCITVDGANVLMPIKEGNPKAVDMGKGMYKSTWGIEFVEGSCVTLHPDGLKTYMIPGTLTSASPLDTFANTSKRPYQWLCDLSDNADKMPTDSQPPHPKHFTITCWFYWTNKTRERERGQKVLLQTTDRVSSLYLDCNYEDGSKVWTLTDEKSVKRPLTTPPLNPGWHMLSLVSSTRYCDVDGGCEGTKFFLDDWHCTIPDVWIKNDFYLVGNDSGSSGGNAGKKPFGLLTDFRIYARVLPESQIRRMAVSPDPQESPELFPDRVVHKLAEMDAAKVLARRLDVPDSAAECLRALASLATLSSQRAKIFSVCGKQVLKMMDSPLPMIQRQAARLLNNIT